MLKLFRNLKPFAIPVVVILVLVAAQAIAELYLPTLMADIVDKGIVQGRHALHPAVGGLMLLVALGGMACAVDRGAALRPGEHGIRPRPAREGLHARGGFSLHEFDMIGTPSLITRTHERHHPGADVHHDHDAHAHHGARSWPSAASSWRCQKDAKLTWVLAVVIPVLPRSSSLVATQGHAAVPGHPGQDRQDQPRAPRGTHRGARHPRLQPDRAREEALRRGQHGPHRRPPSG